MMATSQEAKLDGRRQRGQDNRARIVAAMLDIIRGGQFAPVAEEVAARADVGLRTVFRHFQDMESLYREMSVVIEAELIAVAQQPFRSIGWRDRLIELVERRTTAFEKIAPFRQASDAFRHRSSFLQADHARFVAALRAILLRELPAEFAQPPERVEILDLLLSYEAWSRLRHEQNLSPQLAREALQAGLGWMFEPS
uniref:Transcriptional regulator, TetR family n=1 Tax=Caulobacter sp. (strain K31) TaxID=366602 RepID=B0SY49_CAUSK